MGDSSQYSFALSEDAVLDFWRAVDLEAWKSEMDAQGVTVASNQETSASNRKRLAEATREFKALPATEEKMRSFGQLLRSYQEEIDSLTKRAKYAEQSFLTVYQKLSEAPDPVNTLSAASESQQDLARLQAENGKLKDELEEFRAEATGLKNQQVTIRRLEERNRQLEMRAEEKVKELMELKEKQLAEDSQRNEQVHKEREELMKKELEEARNSVTAMQRLVQSSENQLFKLQTKGDEENAAKESQLQLLSREFERAQQRVRSLEQAQKKMDSESPKDDGRETANIQQLMTEKARIDSLLANREAEVGVLEKELSQAQARAEELSSEIIQRERTYQKSISSLESEVNSLQKELASRPLQSEILSLQKRVKVLQAVGYGAMDLDDDDDDDDDAAEEDWDFNEQAARDEPPSKEGGENEEETVERLLLKKNRKIEHELTQSRNRVDEKQVELDTAVSERESLRVQLQEAKALIATLEDDLQKNSEQKQSSTSSSGLPILSQGEHGAEAQDSSTNSMLSVVCGQRDRFKNRLESVEEEKNKVQVELKQSQDAAHKLRADNVKLYERIRFLQGYKGVSEKASQGTEIESQYKQIYEETNNPFNEFQKRLENNRMKELPLRDRITLSYGKFFLSNKYTRAFIFFYSITLHLLVFTTLYVMSHNSVSHMLAFEHNPHNIPFLFHGGSSQNP